VAVATQAYEAVTVAVAIIASKTTVTNRPDIGQAFRGKGRVLPNQIMGEGQVRRMGTCRSYYRFGYLRLAICISRNADDRSSQTGRQQV
jgi:hypothetical protein